MDRVKVGKYIHSKTGKEYRVIGVAKHSETLEELVIYECLYDNPQGNLWVRPLSMFLEKVIINGKRVSRFEFIEE